MKMYLLKSLFLVAAVTLSGNSTKAQVITKVLPEKGQSVTDIVVKDKSLDPDKYNVIRKGNREMYIPKTLQTTVKKAGEKTVSVNLDIKYDDTKYDFSSLYAFNSHRESIAFYKDPETEKLVVPEDVYNLCCILSPVDAGETIYLFKDNVKLSDNTTVSFDAAEATHVISVKQYNEKGEAMKLPTRDPDTYEIRDSGNVQTIYGGTTIIPVDSYYGNSLTSYTGFLTQNGENIGQDYDVRTNNVGNNIAFVFNRLARDYDGKMFVNKFVQVGCDKDVSLKNDYKNFIHQVEDFIPTPSGVNGDGYGAAGIDVITLCNNKLEASTLLLPRKTKREKAKSLDFYVDASEDTDSEGKGFIYNVMVAPAYGDLWSDDDWAYRNIIGLPFMIKDKKINYIYTTKSGYRTPENGGYAVWYPGHEKFSFTADQKAIECGETASFNNFQAYTHYFSNTGKTACYYYPRYFGLLGEERETDKAEANVVAHLNGEEKYNGNVDGFIDFLVDNAQNSDANGTLSFTFTDNNIEVEGLQGKNVTKVKVDESKADITAPVLQALQFRKNDGIVTNKFDKADEGTLMFAGGDFDYKTESDESGNAYSWYTCKEQTVKAEYAPYGEDSWSEISVNEDPDEYKMPGFGYYYSGSLSSVDRESSNGWYDLKITQTDNAGNTSEQIISPAFHIGKSTGIVSTANGKLNVANYGGTLSVTGADKVGMEVYSADGQCVAKTTDAVRRSVSTGSLTHGIYIVRATADGGKSIVKKIVVK